MEEQSIGELIRSISRKMRNSADADLKKIDLTFAQLQVLGFVKQEGGETTQRRIEHYLNVSHPTVVGLVTRLEKNGYVACSRDENDRRNKLVKITEKAKNMEKKLTKSRKEAEARLVENLTEKEAEELAWLLKLVYTNMDI